MKASFVILTYNRKEEVLKTICKTKELIDDNLEDYEIIVVENGSSDGSAKAIKTAFPEINLVSGHKELRCSCLEQRICNSQKANTLSSSTMIATSKPVWKKL